GDDFVMILRSEGAEEICESILDSFAACAPQFYSEEDRQRGGLLAENRQGESVFFPIVSLSLALQHVSSGSHRNSLQIADNLSELKKQAKRQVGNSLVVERRKR